MTNLNSLNIIKFLNLYYISSKVEITLQNFEKDTKFYYIISQYNIT
jgi:hypothetical protein